MKTVYILILTFVSIPIATEQKLTSTKPSSLYHINSPREDRGEEYRQFLSASLKIKTNEGYVGSGTICYYNPKTNEAWVLSCGHLWPDGQNQPKTAELTFWYHNDVKLNKPRKYRAEIIFYNNKPNYDVSLLRFKPDWKPLYFPIAKNYKVKIGKHYNSLGSDRGNEIARYDVAIINPGGLGQSLKTKYNSPRLGRSGGGLLTNDGYLIGISWAVSSDGQGFFVSLKSIEYVFKQTEYTWLLDIDPPNSPRNIPIIDKNDASKKFPRNYIPMPG
jgi:hypothetical protein